MAELIRRFRRRQPARLRPQRQRRQQRRRPRLCQRQPTRRRPWLRQTQQAPRQTRKRQLKSQPKNSPRNCRREQPRPRRQPRWDRLTQASSNFKFNFQQSARDFRASSSATFGTTPPRRRSRVKFKKRRLVMKPARQQCRMIRSAMNCRPCKNSRAMKFPCSARARSKPREFVWRGVGGTISRRV